MRELALLALAALLTACSDAAIAPVSHPEANPATLSEWGAVASDGETLRVSADVLPYTLAQPLFTDYAHKLRTMWVPDGTARPVEGAAFEFPVGTVITKTFYYPKGASSPDATRGLIRRADAQPVNAHHALDLASHTLVETRVLARRDAGWETASYLWNAEQTEAELHRTGAVVPLELDGEPFSYVVPNENQCAGCHATNASTDELHPLGPRPEQLGGTYDYGLGAEPQLARWREAGWLEATDTPPAWPRIGEGTVEAQARAYLASNCAHCHNPVGPADTSGLDLSWEASDPVALGTCKLPIAAGSGTGGHRYGVRPGRADESILVYRMESRDPGAMMPELGRDLVHEEGAKLVREWIDAMEGDCEG